MEVERRLDALHDAGIDVVAVGFNPPRTLARLRRDLGLTFPVVADTARRWYTLFRVPRGGWRHVFAPRIVRRYARALWRREAIPRPESDLRQLGADALLEGDRIIAVWVSQESERRPSVGEVIARAAGAGS